MHYLEETMPTPKELKDCIRKLVIDRKFVPIFVGSAYRNKGVQTLLDGVIEYLPSPVDIQHYALNPNKVPCMLVSFLFFLRVVTLLFTIIYIVSICNIYNTRTHIV